MLQRTLFMAGGLTELWATVLVSNVAPACMYLSQIQVRNRIQYRFKSEVPKRVKGRVGSRSSCHFDTLLNLERFPMY